MSVSNLPEWGKQSLSSSREKALLKQNSNDAIRELMYIVKTLEKIGETEKAIKVKKLMSDLNFIINQL